MPWECRALPSVNSVKTWDSTADDGHELVLEVEGTGSPTDPLQVSLQVQALEVAIRAPKGFRGRTRKVERWPTLEELLGACDVAGPGLVWNLPFTSMPEGMERETPPPGSIRQIQVQQVGAMQAPSRLVTV